MSSISLGKIAERTEKVEPKAHAGVPFIGLDDIEAHTMRLMGCKDSADLKSSAKRFYKGDVLYSRLRPYLNKVWVADRDGLCSSEFIIFHQPDLINAKFLAYRLNSSDFVAFANSLDSGDRPRVNYKQISKFELPFFDLEDQKRIVAKIEELFSELDNGIQSLKTAREQLKTYRQSLLKHAFEGKLTEQWRKENADKLETPEQLLSRIQQERQSCYQQQLVKWKLSEKKWESNGKKGKRPTKPREPKSVTELAFDIKANLPNIPTKWTWEKLGWILFTGMSSQQSLQGI
ncbi:restriction endonuclease subunit S [Methylobacillus pratensis]